MSTRMTINGVSTCQTAGTEKYESFQLGYGRKRRTLVQYDYRHHTDGELFSCVKPTLNECRAERDKWLMAKERKEGTDERNLSDNAYQVLQAYQGVGRHFQRYAVLGSGNPQRVDR